GEHDFVGAVEDPVRNCLAYLDSGDALHSRRHALQVLDVHGGKDVNLLLKYLEYIFITLLVLAAINVGVRQLIDEHHLRIASDDGIKIHLFEDCAFIFELATWYRFQLGQEFCGSFTSVRFNYTDHDILTALAAADGLAEHVVRFSDTRS